MTDYSPFAEPFTQDLDVIRRRTWEELRRISTAVAQLSDGDNGNGGGAAAYAVGQTIVGSWEPGVTFGAPAARIPLQTVGASANVTIGSNEFVVTIAGNYALDVRLIVSPVGSNELWYLQLYRNGTAFSTEIQINNQVLTSRYVTTLAAANANVGDSFDIRLWSNNVDDRTAITLCEFEFKRLD